MIWRRAAAIWEIVQLQPRAFGKHNAFWLFGDIFTSEAGSGPESFSFRNLKSSGQKSLFLGGLQLANVLASSHLSGKRKEETLGYLLPSCWTFYSAKVWQLIRNSTAECQWLIMWRETFKSENQFWAWWWNHSLIDFWFFIYFALCCLSSLILYSSRWG